MEQEPFKRLIAYRFKNKDLLKEALQHRSYVNDQNGVQLKNNERLEFLGDTVLDLVITHLLMDVYPDYNEGRLSRLRSLMVNETKLSAIAREISMGKIILLSKGEKEANGGNKDSILADAFEALIGAIYLDGGFDNAFEFVKNLFQSSIENLSVVALPEDYKSRLQMETQKRFNTIPKYSVINTIGPDHAKIFIIELKIHDQIFRSSGRNKKSAEQSAAQKAFCYFQTLEK